MRRLMPAGARRCGRGSPSWQPSAVDSDVDGFNQYGPNGYSYRGGRRCRMELHTRGGLPWE